MFEKEIEMSEKFGKFLGDKFKNKKIDYMAEYEGVTGIPDYIIFEKTTTSLKFVVTLELKLKDWKRALEQAYKAKLYSNLVFVVMAPQGISAAKKNIKIFEKLNIGLLEFNSKENLQMYYFPKAELPISELYTSILHMNLKSKGQLKESKNKFKLYNRYENSQLLYKFEKYKVENLT